MDDHFAHEETSISRQQNSSLLCGQLREQQVICIVGVQ
jgi:hypothetical protein